MSEINDPDRAFPSVLQYFPEDTNYRQEQGMTLRDYFAAKALQGFCANPAVFASNGMSGWDLVNCTEDQLAEVCNRLADAMLRARGQS